MKQFRLSRSLLVVACAVSVTQAQVTARRLTERIAPQVRPGQTNAAVRPGPAQYPQGVARPVPQTSAARPPVDPAKALAAKEQTLKKIVEFQKSKAEEGSESAQYQLGNRYLTGDGVEKDEALARKWLTESAKNGFDPASKKLEELDKAAAAAAKTSISSGKSTPAKP